MKRILLYILPALFLLSACNNSPKVKTYQDAEREFLASLTELDTFTVLALGQAFMQDLLPTGNIDSALVKLAVIEDNVLYKLSDQNVAELKLRYTANPITDYVCARYSFSTEVNNDLVYRYTTSGKIGDGAAIKLTLNPVKVEGRWFLTLKDANQYSKDIHPDRQVNPLAPAPYPVKLHKENHD